MGSSVSFCFTGSTSMPLNGGLLSFHFTAFSSPCSSDFSFFIEDGNTHGSLCISRCPLLHPSSPHLLSNLHPLMACPGSKHLEQSFLSFTTCALLLTELPRNCLQSLVRCGFSHCAHFLFVTFPSGAKLMIILALSTPLLLQAVFSKGGGSKSTIISGTNTVFDHCGVIQPVVQVPGWINPEDDP